MFKKLRFAACAALVLGLVFAALDARAVTIDTALLPNGMEMVAYDQSLSASGGTSPYTWDVVAQTMERAPNSWASVSAAATEPLDLHEDDNVRGPFALPFAFPFYGKTYTQVWINPNGGLFFGENCVSYYSDVFSSAPGVLFVGGRDNGTRWTGDDIFVCTNASIAIFRYAGHGYSERTDEPSTINAAVVLKPDGELRIVYGTVARDGNPSYTVGIGCSNSLRWYQDFSQSELSESSDFVFKTGVVEVPGLALTSGGVLSGKPMQAGEYPLFVRATDAAEVSAVKPLVLSVAANSNARPVITAASDDYQTTPVGESLTFSVTAEDPDGAAPSYKWLLDGVEQGEAGSSFTVTPTALDYGEHNVKVFVNDSVWTDVVSTQWTYRVTREWYVNGATGNDTADGTSAGTAFKTISRGYGVAGHGDTVRVASGVYRDCFSPTRAVRFVSETGNPEDCIIDAEGRGRCADCSGSEWGAASFTGFTLRNGTTSSDGGCVCGGSYFDCILTGGYSGNYGGGASHARLVRCRVYGNFANHAGGCDACIIEDSTIYGNEANSSAGGVYAWSSGSATRSIIWGNRCRSNAAKDNVDPGNDNLTLENCHTSGDPGLFFPEGGDFRLKVGSVCLKSSTSENIGWYKGSGETGVGVLVKVDGTCASMSVNGTPGVSYVSVGTGGDVTLSVTPDALHPFLGWFENDVLVYGGGTTFVLSGLTGNHAVTAKFGPGTIYVDGNHGDDANDGSSEANAKKTIQAAVDATISGDAVLVLPGTYAPFECPAAYNDDKCVTVRARDGRATTIVDGGGTSPCVMVSFSADAWCTNLVVIGFTLQNGKNNSSGGAVHMGRYIDCLIRNSTANSSGGGANRAILENCEISGNTAGQYGGGANRCRIYRSKVVGNTFAATYGDVYGAGVANCDCYDSLICGNTIPDGVTGSGAGAWAGSSSTYNLVNCTVADNINGATVQNEGAGVAGRYKVCNSIVYGNKNGSTPSEVYLFNNSDFICGMTTDPSFVDAAHGNYALADGSAAIDAGRNCYVSSETDLAGATRLQGAAVDYGCYESTPVLSFINSMIQVNGGAPLGDSGKIYVNGGTEPYTFAYDASDRMGYVSYQPSSYWATGVRNDALSQNSGYYDLPFAFPFGGETFTRVFVNNYGGLSFSPNEIWGETFQGYNVSFSYVTNQGYRAIIPYNGYFQFSSGDPAQGVFVAEDPSVGSVTFRWAGTYNGSEPLEFSCTLYSSGKFQFDYGAYSPTVMGFSGAAVVKGVSWADHTGIDLANEVPYDSSQSRSFEFTPVSMPPAEQMVLNADGVPTGTPTKAGRYFVKTTVSDDSGHTATKWLPIEIRTKYSVRFDANGGEGAPMADIADVEYEYGSVDIPDCSYKLDNSTFLGWATNATGSVVFRPGDTVRKLTDVANDVVTFYAVWQLNLLTESLSSATGGTAYSAPLLAAGGTLPLTWSWTVATSNYAASIRAPNSFADVGTAQPWGGDDFAQFYELPFAFNFYGETYTNVWVSSNGTLSFGDDGFKGYSYSEYTLASHAMIAVAWADWNVTSGKPIKIAADASAATFSWTVDEYGGVGTAGFSCTLKSDGSIALKYGPNAFTSAAVGISAGDGKRYEYRQFSGGELASAEDFVFAYPVPDSFSLHPVTGVITDAAGDGSQLTAGTYPVRVTVRSADGQAVSHDYVISATTSYKVRFNARGGTGEMADLTCPWGSDTTLTANAFTFAGSTFQGWATNENGEVVFEDGGTVRDLDPHQGAIVNLYAVWTVQVPAQSLPVAQGGVDYAGALTAQGASEPVTWTLDGESAMPPGLTLNADGTITGRPTVGGIYEFVVRATDALESAAVQTLTITNKTTYFVRFNKSESAATGEMADEEFVYLDAPKALTACGFTCPAYDFIGWATNSSWDADVVYTNGQEVANLTDRQGAVVNLYAKWHPGYYTIAFDANGGETTPALTNRAVEVGSYVKMPSSGESPTRLGYAFNGWATSSSGSASYYSDGVYGIDQPRDTTLTLYATWRATDHYRTETVDGNEWTFRCSGEMTRLDTLRVTNGATTVTIPATVLGGRPITQFGYQLLQYATNVTELVFADGLTGFASGSNQSAFGYSRDLERVTFPDGFTNVLNSAFNGCSKLREVTFGSGLVEIGYCAFDNCSKLVEVSLPASVKKIDGYAFYNVRKAAFAGAVNEVGTYAFYNARRLRFAGAAPAWSVATACNSGNLHHIQHGDDPSWSAYAPPAWSNLRVYRIGVPLAGADGNSWYVRDDGATVALVDPGLASGAVTLPDTLGGKPVTVLADCFLAGCGSVSSVVIPPSVTNVEDYAFYTCPALTEIFVAGESLKYSSQSVYQYSPIAHVYYLPQHAAKWAGKTLFNCALEPWPAARCWTAQFDANAADAVGEMADQLQPAGFEVALAANAFRCPNKKFVRWETDDDPPAQYADGAVPASHGSGSTVTFRAVWQDAVLYTVEFDMNGGKPGSCPSAVDLEVGVAESTTVLPTLTQDDRENSWTFLGWSTNSTAAAADYAGGAAYRDAAAAQNQTVRLYAIWQEREDWTDRYEPAEGYSSSGYRITYRYYGDGVKLRNVSFSESDGTFAPPATIDGRPVTIWVFRLSFCSGYDSVRSVVIPRTVMTMYDYALSSCANLTSVVFEASSAVKQVPSGFCQYCPSLAHVVLPDAATSISSYAFYQCSALREVEIPDTVTFIGSCAFSDCTNLTSVVLPRTLARLTEYNVFSGCPIERLELPATFVNAASYSLYGTKAFRCLGDRPTWRVDYATSSTVKSFEFPATNTTWNAGPIANYPSANVTYRGFVGPIATMGAEKCYFWTNANETVTFAYAEDALGAEVEVPAVVTWGGVDWTVTGFEPNAFAGQPTTSVRYPREWTERMWGVDPTTLADGITSARPVGAYCTVRFAGGTGATGTMADFYVPTGHAAHLPANAFVRSAYLFTKWQKLTAPTADYLDGAEFTGLDDGTVVTLDASWKYVGNYTIRFAGNSANATGVPGDINTPVGSTPAIPADPVREGWTFGGWTNAVNDHVYFAEDAFDEGCAADAVFTLCAKWTPTTDSNLQYVDGTGSTWIYSRTGDEVTLTGFTPGATATVVSKPSAIKGGAVVNRDTFDPMTEYVNGVWWKYEVDGNSKVHLKGATMVGTTDVVVPSEIVGKTVVELKSSCFMRNARITSVVLPDTLTTYSDYGILGYGCTALTNAVLPSTMTHMPDEFFYQASALRTVVIPAGLTGIDARAFVGCEALEELELPTCCTDVDNEAFNYKTGSVRGFGDDGFRFADADHRFLVAFDGHDCDELVIPDGTERICNEALMNLTSRRVVIPEGVVAVGYMCFCMSDDLESVELPSTLESFVRHIFYRTSTKEVSFYASTLPCSGSGDQTCGTTTITNVFVRGGAPDWDLKSYFTGLTTVVYSAQYAAEWADYRAAHPELEYVEETTEEPTGQYLKTDLVGGLGIEIPEDVDYALGDKVTVKVEGLAKGLKVVATPVYEDPNAKKKVIADYIYTIEGVPTEAIDFEQQPMFARVTTTYKDKTKGDKGKVETLQPIVLSITTPEPSVLTPGVLNQVYGPADIATLWPEVADAKVNPKDWSFKGWPAGLKYNATAKDASWSYKDGKATVKTNAEPWTVYGQPTKAGEFPITATWKHKLADGKTTVSETFSAVLTVWGDDGASSFRYTDQAYVATATKTLDATYKSFTGLPTGIKWTAKLIAADAKKGTPEYPAFSLYGMPTKAGVFAVTATKVDPADPAGKKTVKETFLWKVAPATAPTFALDTGTAPIEDLKAQIVQGANQAFAITTSDIAAKVTVTGLPTGLKLVATPVKDGSKTVGNTYSIEGVASKPGEYFVTFKTVLNGVTTVTTTAFTVKANPFTATYRGYTAARPAAGAAYRLAVAEVSVAAAGTVTLTYTEGKTKYTANVKSFDWNDATGKGTVEGLVLKVSSADKTLGYGDRKATLTFEDFGAYVYARLDIADANGSSLVKRSGSVFEVVKTTEVPLPASQTFVFQAKDGADTNALATLSVAYDAKKATAAFSGKLYDGTAVKATVPVTRWGYDGNSNDYVFAPFLVIAKDGTVYRFDCFSSDEGGGYVDWVSEDGEEVEESWSTPADYALADAKFAELVPEEGAFTFGWGSDAETVGMETESFEFEVTTDAKGNPAGVAIYDADPQPGEKPLATVMAKVGKATGAISVSFTSKKGDKAKYAVELVWRGEELFAGHVTRTWKEVDPVTKKSANLTASGTAEVK